MDYIVLNPEQRKKLQSIQLNILIEYIRICEKHQLTYYLLGGSCIGAVRHKGFIPWDDDIDVGMPRPDYEKFLEIAQSELPEHYFLQTGETDPEYPSGFAKIRNSNTTFIEHSVSHLKINHGVYFDIFPLDGLCTSRIFKLKRRLYLQSIYKCYNNGYKPKGIDKLLSVLSLFVVPDYRKASRKLDKLYASYKYEDHSMSASYYGAWGIKERFPRDKCFGSGSPGSFEGLSVMLPEDPDCYCKQLYGDYMKLPPEEKRVTHHYCDVIDLDRPYREYI